MFGGAPYVVLTPGIGGADHTIATVDPTFFSLADNMVADLSQVIASGATTRLSNINLATLPTPTTTAPLAYAPTDPPSSDAYSAIQAVDGAPQSNERNGVWISPFGGGRGYFQGTPSLDATLGFAGITAGIDRQATDRLRIGMFGAGAASRLQVDQDSQRIDTTIGAGGAYAYWGADNYFLTGVLSAGLAQNNSHRTVLNNLAPNGIEDATADFGSWYVTPELRAGSRRSLSKQVDVVPTARISYTSGWLDGYKESGSSANLTVDGRDVEILESGVTLPFVYTPATAPQLRLEAHADLFGRVLLGGEGTDVSLLGQNLNIQSSGNNLIGGGGGAAFSYRAFGSASLFGSMDIEAATDGSIGGTATGGLRVPF